MANVLSTDKQIAAISALAEGSSIRSIERMTGVRRDTIMRLGVRVGRGCAGLLDRKISSDALRAYVDAIEQTFGADVDFGQIVKTYEHDFSQHPEYKYSAPKFVSVEKRPVIGNPDMDLVSTSYIERLNATTRLHMRRLTRLTLAFSKKLENFEAAVALHFAYYNFVKRHNTLRCNPAMAAGIERDFWTVGDLVEAAAA